MDLPEKPSLDVPSFEPVPDLPDLPEAEGWDVARVQSLFDEAVTKSLDTKEEVTVELPHGEILIDGQIQFSLPAHAKINVVGHEQGSRLKLHPSRSELSKEWGKFATKTLLYVPDMQGELSLSNIQFHGGSERAGVEGYTPPPSPWDAVVLIVGAGEGNRHEPAMHRAGQREGSVTVKDCQFHKSESEGVMVQNLASAEFEGVTGKNLDVLINSTWCDTLRIADSRGERFTSDGFYITSNQDVVLSDCQIKTARQAYDLQGARQARLNRCHSYDAGIAWSLTGSETDKKTVSGDISLEDCHSDGCMMVAAVGGVKDLSVVRSRHANVGKWWLGYFNREFLHHNGIVSPEHLAHATSPIVQYEFTDRDKKSVQHTKERKFDQMEIQIAKIVTPRMAAYAIHELPNLPGVTYSRLRK